MIAPMRTMLRLALALAVFATLSATTEVVALRVVALRQTPPDPGRRTPDSVTAFVGVTVVPMDRERVIANQTVVVRGQSIAEVGPASTVNVPVDAVRIDGRGKFLMPGLAEMHAHIPGGQAPDELIERTLYLFTAAGVTTIRGMLGHPRHLPLRDRAARGEIISPTIYTTGPSFNGQTATDADVARRMVAEQKAAGYDLLKIHPGVPRPVFDALASSADRLGIRFAGHVPADVGIHRALEAKFASIDHIDGFIEGLVKDDTPKNVRDNPGFFGVNLLSHVDESKIAPLVAKTKANGVWIVPTEHLMELFMNTEDPEVVAKRPEIQYMPRTMVEGWIKQRKVFLAQPELTPEKMKAFLALRKRLIKALHDGGVGLLLGSDAIQTMSVPGFSIHGELKAVAKAGLKPYDVYVTGSRNVAAYFGTGNEVGTVATGRRADLVLVDANPLADVANFSKQAGVMVRGRWLPRSEIDARLAQFTRER
jgi:imidazolonepropionase-like amidohydrolase